ncbi:hypothetical protein ABE504_21965 [Paenibacillus oryzisoli]|uniref:hypothetical protein n=1 Tax=Paenibacillus oryzisoli TaxID=1850517 RepID=UPI003D2A2185
MTGAYLLFSDMFVPVQQGGLVIANGLTGMKDVNGKINSESIRRRASAGRNPAAGQGGEPEAGEQENTMLLKIEDQAVSVWHYRLD